MYNIQEDVDTDKVVTDIVFVSSKESYPLDYTIIEHTYEGHNAQLLESGIGRQKGSSYLCFKKERPKKYDIVIEDMYIHTNKAEAPKEGYEIIELTLDGNKAMRHMKLAIKKVLRYKAQSFIFDIDIYQNKNKVIIPADYTVLPKVNNLRITYMLANVDDDDESQVEEAPVPSSSGKKKLGNILKRLSPFKSKTHTRIDKDKADNPITDIVIVASLDNVPRPGYTVIETCETGQDAQLWFNELNCAPQKRYLCYSRIEQKVDSVVESIYMLGTTDNVSDCIDEKYSIIKKTVEGKEALKWKKLAVKKVPRCEFRKAIVDIKIFHAQDMLSIPKKYTAVNWCVNNLVICIKEHDKRGKLKL